jgi:hypothetical protein
MLCNVSPVRVGVVVIKEPNDTAKGTENKTVDKLENLLLIRLQAIT